MTPSTRYLRHLTRIFCKSLSRTQSFQVTAHRFDVSVQVVKECIKQADRIGLLESAYVKKAISNRAAFRRVLKSSGFSREGSDLKRSSRKCRGLVDVSAEQAAKLKEIHKLYKELKSYQAVGDKLGLSRERVRQLLVKGAAAGLFEHEVTNRLRRKQLENHLPKSVLAQEVSEFSCANIAHRYGVPTKAVIALCEEYGLITQELRQERNRKRTLNEYTAMVNYLGYHPSTGDMNRAGYRALWARISRHWGSFENFRKIYDIPFAKKPVTWLHKMSVSERETREQQLQQILRTIGEYPGIGATDVASKIGISYSAVARHVLRQEKLGVVKRTPRTKIGVPAQLYLVQKLEILAKPAFINGG